MIDLDVSPVSTAVCVLGEKSRTATEAQVASAPDALVSLMTNVPHKITAIGLGVDALSNQLHERMNDA